MQINGLIAHHARYRPGHEAVVFGPHRLTWEAFNRRVNQLSHALRDAGAGIGEISPIGGGARSPVWRQLLADALDLTLTYRADGDVGPALGAAHLAMIGVDSGDRDAAFMRVCRQPLAVARYQPRAMRSAVHRAKLARYRKLYQLTKSLRQATLPPAQ